MFHDFSKMNDNKLFGANEDNGIIFNLLDFKNDITTNNDDSLKPIQIKTKNIKIHKNVLNITAMPYKENKYLFMYDYNKDVCKKSVIKKLSFIFNNLINEVTKKVYGGETNE